MNEKQETIISGVKHSIATEINQKTKTRKVGLKVGIIGGIFRDTKDINGCKTIKELKWAEYKGDVEIYHMSENYDEVFKKFREHETVLEPRDFNLNKLGKMYVAWR